MIVTQRNGRVFKRFVEDSNGRLVERLSVASTPWLHSRLYAFFQDVFLPQGYPESVSSDYVLYQLWDTMQAFCSSLTGALAMKAVLGGYGVGDESKTVLAAAITWLLKDGTSMCGRIGFAWWNGSRLDSDAKQWRLFADVMNDAAIFLELVSQYLPRAFFTPVICLAGVGKAIVGVAGGATRAALTQHQAKCNNMADVSAKDGSQETLVNLAALLVNLWLLPFVDGRHITVWVLFLLFTIGHVYSNFKAVSSVVMETLNLTRFFLLFEEWNQGWNLDMASDQRLTLSPPPVINARESVWRRNHDPSNSGIRINFATSIETMTRSHHPQSFSKMVSSLNIGNDIHDSDLPFVMSYSPVNRVIDVLLREDCRVEDELCALYMASKLRHRVRWREYLNAHESDNSLMGDAFLSHDLKTGYEAFKKSLVERGWDVNNLYFDSKSFRYSLIEDASVISNRKNV